MRRSLTALALALSLLGCAAEVPPSFTITADIYYTGWGGCTASTYLVGLLMIDRTVQPNRLVVHDDRGDMKAITWRGSYRFRMAGDEVEIVDGWRVVATSGRRYKIGGGTLAGSFWACGDITSDP